MDGRECVARALRDCKAPRVAVMAIGKAAAGMARGARQALGTRIGEMLIITKEGHRDPGLDGDRVCQLESPHPMPDVRSLRHGQALADALQRVPSDVLPLFLVSGGSSSLVEALRDGVSLEDLFALNLHGLASGWDIATLNAERAKLSRIKGGGLSRLLGDRPALALFLSDVPGDDPEVIGSGLLGHGDRTDRIERHVVASVDVAMDAACGAARSRGLEVERGSARFDGDAVEVARTFVAALRNTPAAALVWGGESTVRLPVRTGRGGRNTHLALAAARLLRADEPLTILAAGTDGTDGPTDDAGAMVDCGTIERAELAGCDVERAFREFDSGTALEMSGDLVHTGPTGTNVGDLLIGIKHPANSLRGLARPRVL